MLALVLFLMTASDQAPTGLELVSRVVMPIKTNSIYAYEAIATKPPNASVVFSVAAQDANQSDNAVTLRFDGATKSVSLLDGNLDLQEDCDLGLAGIRELDNRNTRVIDVASGRTLSTIDALIDRVGALGVERIGPTARSTDRLRLFDVRTGKVLRKIGQYSNSNGYIGRAAWDDGNLRMLAAQRHDGARYRDGYVLYKTKGDGFERADSVQLFDFAMGFDRIVGNPALSLFAAEYSTNRRIYYVTLTQELRKTKFQVDQVLDVSRFGVLGRMIVKENQNADPDLSPIGCWNPLTGKKMWQLPKNSHETAQWLDRCALVGEELRDPRTGKVLYRLPRDRTFIAARGDTIWLLSNGPVRKLEVWRVR